MLVHWRTVLPLLLIYIKILNISHPTLTTNNLVLRTIISLLDDVISFTHLLTILSTYSISSSYRNQSNLLTVSLLKSFQHFHLRIKSSNLTMIWKLIPELILPYLLTHPLTHFLLTALFCLFVCFPVPRNNPGKAPTSIFLWDLKSLLLLVYCSHPRYLLGKYSHSDICLEVLYLTRNNRRWYLKIFQVYSDK